MADTTPQESSFSIVNALSLVIVVAYVAAMPMWMWWPPTKVPPEILAIINQMMGAWGMAFATVVAFHLGSSRASKDAQKATTDTMAALSATAATTANTAAAIAGAPTNGVSKMPPVVAAQVDNTKATLENTAAINGLTEETAAWNDAVAANMSAAFDGYLQRFPTGAHAADAKARSDALKNP